MEEVCVIMKAIETLKMEIPLKESAERDEVLGIIERVFEIRALLRTIVADEYLQFWEEGIISGDKQKFSRVKFEACKLQSENRELPILTYLQIILILRVEYGVNIV